MALFDDITLLDEMTLLDEVALPDEITLYYCHKLEWSYNRLLEYKNFHSIIRIEGLRAKLNSSFSSFGSTQSLLYSQSSTKSDFSEKKTIIFKRKVHQEDQSQAKPPPHLRRFR